MRRPWRARVIACAIVLAAVVGWASPAAANISGAVFTTNVVCNGTNVNIFASKPDVYLNGGPQKSGSAGLPDGFYYVRVTTPDGALVLGSSVTASVQVVNGAFVQCYQLVDILYSGTSGFTVKGFDDTTNAGGEYKLWVSQESGFPDNKSKTDDFKVLPGVTCPPDNPECQVPPPGSLEACKFYDLDTDGVHGGAEVGIEGWRMTLTSGGTLPLVQYTAANGCTIFSDLPNGIYTVTEGTPIESNWFHTGSVSLDRDVEDDTPFVEFGNVCVGDGGGKTLGFWSNKNGQALFNKDGSGNPDFGAGSLALLDSLHLRNGNGSDFDPASYAQYKTWDLNGTAVNMAYMLSVQLAAMELNVFHNLVDGNALIYAPGTNSANSTGFATVNAVMAEADAALAAQGSVLAGDPLRGYYEDLKNALDNANNSKTFVQAGPCPFTFPLLVQ
jgi:hypothetical protein